MRTYLLFTNNFPLSQLEIFLLEGCITKKISNRAFFATLPASVKKSDLKYCLTECPEGVDKDVAKVVTKWNSWDQSFLPLYR